MNKYLVWGSGRFGECEEDARIVEAVSEYEAAVEWADMECDGDPAICERFLQGSVEVSVKSINCGTVSLLQIYGQTTIEFIAYKK